MFETFAKTHIDQLFNIIIEFPESEPAILDLKICLEKTDLRGTLVSSLKTALETRLLHPGLDFMYTEYLHHMSGYSSLWGDDLLYINIS